MRIYLLEDNFDYQIKVEQCIMTAITENNCRLSYLEIFSSPERLLEMVSIGGIGQVYFLKIGLQEHDSRGLELAKQIRRLDPFAHIIFMTSQLQYMPKVFELHIRALDYIDKTLGEADLIERLSRLFLDLKELANVVHEEIFTLITSRQQICLPVHQIFYFETSTKSHYVNMVTKSKTIEFEGNLTDIVDKNPKFYRCHRSFVVNVERIVRLDRKNRLVEFENGDTCLISRSNLSGLLDLIRKR